MQLIPVPWSSSPIHIIGLSTALYPSEIGFQIYCADYLKRKGLRFHHSANERKGLTAGMFAKRMGQSKGFPDFLIFGLSLEVGGGFAALELKLPDGKVSKEQLDWLAYFKSIGWHAEVVRSFERFKEIVESSTMKIIS